MTGLLQVTSRHCRNKEQAIQVLRRMYEEVHDLDWSRNYVLSLREAKGSRSLHQNRRYWAMLGEIAEFMASKMDGEYHRPEAWHELLKARYLGHETIEYNGETAIYPRSSAKLSTADFGDFMTKVEAWAVLEGVQFDFAEDLRYE